MRIDGKLCTTLIDNTYLDKWELSKEDVLEQAMDNTVKMAPPRFYDGMQLKLSILTGRYGGIPIKEFSPTENERRYGCFLSTDKKTEWCDGCVLSRSSKDDMSGIWYTSYLYCTDQYP